MDTRIPVTIISGFLGAGKTTLINRLLSSDAAQNLTVLVNDFGAVNIDTDLIIKREREVMELSNGCVCCSIQSDMVAQLQTMFTGDNPPESLLIETSGVAQPGRIAAVFGYPQLKPYARLDSVITLLDVSQIGAMSEDATALIRCQIEAADMIVATKPDLVDQATRQAIYAQWLFPDLPVVEAIDGDVPVGLLLDTDRQSAGRDWSEVPLPGRFVTAHWSSATPVSYSRLRDRLNAMSAALYRAKGILCCSEFPEKRIVFNKVGSRVDFAEMGTWEGAPESTIVGIGEAGQISAERIRQELEMAHPQS